MKFLLAAFLALLPAIPTTLVAPAAAIAAAEDDGALLVDAYLKASRQSQQDLRSVKMTVEMRASIPRLNREGGMKATRSISAGGEISYTAMTFDGNESIKKDVIARYLQAEVEASKQPALGITPDNYKFKYWGIYGTGDWQLHLFELTPKRKVAGLFQGWLWVEAKTFLPVREQGRFVKNPSVFLKRVEFVRDYDIRYGMARPMRVESTILTRIVGEAKLSIQYSDYSRTAAPINANATAVPKTLRARR